MIQIPNVLINLYDRHWKKRISPNSQNTTRDKRKTHISLMKFDNHDLNQASYRPTNEFGIKPDGNHLGSNWPHDNTTSITDAVLDLSRQIQIVNKRFAILEEIYRKKNSSNNYHVMNFAENKF